MSKVIYCLLLSILLALANVAAGCGSVRISGDNPIQRDTSGSTDRLPAVQLTSETEFGFVIYKLKNKNNNNSKLYLGQYEKQKNGGYIDKELNNVEIEEKPLLTDRDIKKFNWKTNTFILTENFLKNHPLEEEDIKLINESNQNIEGWIHLSFYSGSKLLNCVDTDSAVILVSGKRIYTLGFALPVWSSRYPPEIYLEDAGLNSVRIHSAEALEEFARDKRIYDFFKQQGKLEE